MMFKRNLRRVFFGLENGVDTCFDFVFGVIFLSLLLLSIRHHQSFWIGMFTVLIIRPIWSTVKKIYKAWELSK
jgi:hypothetical protein